MTKDEAKTAVANGEKVTHSSFEHFEWLRKSKKLCGHYEFENGAQCSVLKFWDWREEDSWLTGWSIVQ